MTDANVRGGSYVGVLAGSNVGSIINSYVDGYVTGSDNVGGLVGQLLSGGLISGASSSVFGSGATYVGGLVGRSAGSITNSYATGNLTGTNYVGGLVGGLDNTGVITNSYATGNVFASTNYAGGLVGQSAGSIGTSYASGNVSASLYIGGLVGYVSGGSVNKTYALGGVTGSNYIGGLVGYSDGNISNSYATGSVSGGSYAGGLIGYQGEDGGTTTNSYWDTVTTGKTTGISFNIGSGTPTGLTTTQAMLQTSFTGFDFTNDWWISDTNTRPFLRTEYSTNIVNTHQLQLVSLNLSANYTLGQSITMSELSNAHQMWDTTKGFVPIDDNVAGFRGHFDGRDRSISGLNINRTGFNLGLFGRMDTVGSVTALDLLNFTVFGQTSDAYTTSVYVGGLVGQNLGAISDVRTSGNVYSMAVGYGGSGGLAGGNSGMIVHSRSSGSVTGLAKVGGLVGVNEGGAISDSYVSGMGLFSYAGVGGLVGYNSGGTITDAYATANVTGTGKVGGLVGLNQSGTITNTYANGHVTGDTQVGGLVGANAGYVGNSFWDMDATGYSRGIGSDGTGTASVVVGLTSDQMLHGANFTGFDISGVGNVSTVWRMYENNVAPLLRSFLKVLDVGGGTSTTYNGTTQYGEDLGEFPLTYYNARGRNVGVHTAYSDQEGYDIVGGDLTITRAIVTVGVSASRTYDGTSLAGVASAISGTIFAGDSISGGTFFFNNKNVGTGKTITGGSATINDGVSGANYNISYVTSTSGTITQAYITLSGNGAARTYDGTTLASGNATRFAGTLFAGDSIVGGTFAYNNKNVGTTKTIIGGGSAIGDSTASGNYNISYVTSTSGTITQAYVTLAGNTAARTYDGTTTVSGSATRFAGTVFAGDSIVGGVFAYSNKNVGTAKTITGSGSTIGDSGASSNYNISYVTNTSGTITQAFVTLSGNTVARTYDGTTVASGTATRYIGTVFAGDSIVGGTFTYNNKNVGTTKTVTGSGAVIGDGSALDNYNVSYVTNTSGTITQAFVTLSGNTAARTYDGTTTASGSATRFAGTVFAGDSIVGGVFAYSNKNVGTAKTITGSGASIGDSSASSNYNISYVSSTSGMITQAYVTLQSNAAARTYDATTVASGSATRFAGTVFAGDSIVGGVFAYNDKNVGTAKTVTNSASTIGDGSASSNYNISYVTNTSATITQAYLTLSGNTVARTYDGTTVASGTATRYIGTVFAGDSIVGGTFTYNNKNVGTTKTLTVSGAVIGDGSALDNYNVSYMSNTRGTITQAFVTLSGNTAARTYDGTTAASGSATRFAGTVFAGDSIVGGAFVYSDKNAGTAKTITGSGSTIGDGSASSNYNIIYASSTSGTITQAYVTLQSNAAARTYDATTVASGSATRFAGTVFAGDSIVGGAFAYNDKNVGTTKTVTSSASTIVDSSASSNYNITYVTNTSGTITQAFVTLQSDAVACTYDATTLALGTATRVSGTIFSGDSIVGGTFTYDDKNVGTAKVITTRGVSVADGTASGNYDITYISNTAGTITQAYVTLQSNLVARTYDATRVAASTATRFAGTIFSGDSIVGGTFTYDDKNAGTTKTITSTRASVADGTTSNNYNISYVTNTLGTITQAYVTLQSNAASRTYDATTVAAGSATKFAGTVFAGDSIVGGAFVYNDKNVGTTKTIVSTSATISDGSVSTNYNISYVTNTAGTINRAALSVTANDDMRVADNVAYSGGNGVTYSGFVADETDAELTGTLNYGGSSQEAKTPGEYAITPSGLSATNYTLSYHDGVLLIKPGTPTDVVRAALGEAGVQQFEELTRQAISPSLGPLLTVLLDSGVTKPVSLTTPPSSAVPQFVLREDRGGGVQQLRDLFVIGGGINLPSGVANGEPINLTPNFNDPSTPPKKEPAK